MLSYRHVWKCLLLIKLFFINIQTYPNEYVYVSSCVCSIVYLINLFDWFFIKQKIFFIICISLLRNENEQKKFLWHFDYETWYCCEYCLKAYIRYVYDTKWQKIYIFIFQFLFIYEAFYIHKGRNDDMRWLKRENVDIEMHENWKLKTSSIFYPF